MLHHALNAEVRSAKGLTTKSCVQKYVTQKKLYHQLDLNTRQPLAYKSDVLMVG